VTFPVVYHVKVLVHWEACPAEIIIYIFSSIVHFLSIFGGWNVLDTAWVKFRAFKWPPFCDDCNDDGT